MAFLEKRGHKIVTARYNTGHGELDIISLHKKVLVFTEVKTRRDERFRRVAWDLTYQKQRTMKKAAWLFRRWECPDKLVPFYPFEWTTWDYKRKYTSYRFDYAEVVLGLDGTIRIVHIKDVF